MPKGSNFMNEIKEKIYEHLESLGIYLNQNEDDDANICEYGMDSLSYIVFISDLEAIFGIDIPDDYLNIQKVVSINKIATLIKQITI